jgi:hypothetical protein
LLPIVWRQVEDAAVPERLKRLNYIFFTEGHAFGISLRGLAQSLNSNFEWIREHTSLGELAVRWDGRDRPDALLLRGNDIDESKRWLAQRPKEAPEPTELHRAFITESERNEREIRARTAAQEAALKDAEVIRERLAREKAEQAAKAAEALALAARKTTRRTLLGLAVCLVLFSIAALLGWKVLDQQKSAEVQRATEEVARAIASESLGETSRTLLEVGSTAKALQSATEALRFSQALAQKSSRDLAQQRDVAISYLRLGDVLQAAGKHDHAH